jgi:5'-nucleotidase
MRLKTIAVDLDTTLNNLEEVWIANYNRDYNDNLTPEDMVVWNTAEIVKPECGKKIYDYLLEPNFFLNLDIKPNAREVMDQLNEDNEVYIVTAYHYDTCADKARWVIKNLPFLDIRRQLVFMYDKFMFNADILIDDGAHNITAFPNDVIIFDAPHNRYLGDLRYKRAKNWLEVGMYFTRWNLCESVESV